MSSSRPSKRKNIEQYDHQGQTRLNNPPVGLVTPETDPEPGEKKTYAYDPHLDPQLVWSGKAEHTSFEVPTVSLHVHERIEPRAIIDAVRKRDGHPLAHQLSFFEMPRENPPIREAIEFYKHPHDWSNRLIAGDSLLVMSSLLEKEGLAGQVQMIYIDPPYGVRYGSNFQPFVNKRDVSDGKDEDLTQEPEMIRAFRDTWELGIHSYLTYLRNRLLLARELLTESGSVFVQISDDNVHHVRQLMDEVFGTANAVVTIVFKKKSATTPTDPVNDYVLWYAKKRDKLKVRQIYLKRRTPEADPKFNTLISPTWEMHRVKDLTEGEDSLLLGKGWRWARVNYPLVSQGENERSKDFTFQGKMFKCGRNRHWTYDPNIAMQRLAAANRLFDGGGESLGGVVFWDDWPFVSLSNVWDDIHGEPNPIYVVQTTYKAVQRCLLITTDPGDLVFDPTCGSGTTAYMAEQWGRRWITCDTSRVAITLAKQRLMTAFYDYYELAQLDEGVRSGFKYKTVPHITLKSIANNEPPKEEILYDQPLVDKSKARVTGPFSVEAVPAPVVKPLVAITQEDNISLPADQSVSRSGETQRQRDWRDELLKTGIRGKGGQRIEFSRVEPLPGVRHLHAEGETKGENPERVVISFGPEHAPLEQRQVTLALDEAQTLVPRPRLVVFAAFQFDPEAAKDIDETNWPGVTLLKAQMNTDLLTEDLKKKRASNDSFWLIGQPDVDLRRITSGEQSGQSQLEVRGFDYFDTRTGELVSGGPGKIAMWLLDPDYDGRSLLPRQVFFPMAGEQEGWARLARSLKAGIDEELIEAYRGTVSLPFELGDHRRVAVKIVDDRGIESLKIIEAE